MSEQSTSKVTFALFVVLAILVAGTLFALDSIPTEMWIVTPSKNDEAIEHIFRILDAHGIDAGGVGGHGSFAIGIEPSDLYRVKEALIDDTNAGSYSLTISYRSVLNRMHHEVVINRRR